MCSWCNRWWWDTWRREGDCIGKAALWCKSHLLFLLFFSSLAPFFFFSPSIPPPPLCHSCSVFAPFSLSSLLPPSFTLFSIQEVLELAFSVLYESDEYLNFIAPDKHEVSQRCPAPADVHGVRQNEQVSLHKEKGFSMVYKCNECGKHIWTGNDHQSLFKLSICNMNSGLNVCVYYPFLESFSGSSGHWTLFAQCTHAHIIKE